MKTFVPAGWLDDIARPCLLRDSIALMAWDAQWFEGKHSGILMRVMIISVASWAVCAAGLWLCWISRAIHTVWQATHEQRREHFSFVLLSEKKKVSSRQELKRLFHCGASWESNLCVCVCVCTFVWLPMLCRLRHTLSYVSAPAVVLPSHTFPLISLSLHLALSLRLALLILVRSNCCVEC